MKKVSLLITICLAVAFCKAQDRPHPSMEEHLKRSQEMLQKELQMNSDQQKKVEQAFKDFIAEAEKLHKEYPPPPPPPMDPKTKAALDKLEQERDAKVKMALTAEQYQKYIEVAKKMHPPHPGGMPKENPPS
jgi:hypothetical protein